MQRDKEESPEYKGICLQTTLSVETAEFRTKRLLNIRIWEIKKKKKRVKCDQQNTAVFDIISKSFENEIGRE